MSEVTLKDLLQQLAEERNLDLRGYKVSSLERRFRHRMFQLKMLNYTEYAQYIRDHPAEINDLLNTVLINVTEFFRDPQAWDVLRREILPELLEGLKPGDSFRAWSAGCASGEEAYSLAIMLAEHFGPAVSEYDIKVYATDVDDEALNLARRGEYEQHKLRRVRPEWREKYFQGERMCRIKRDIRRLAIFGRGNLGLDAPISHVDLLLCRNVLIYFDSQLQKHILARLHYALRPGGILFLGKSESQLMQNSQFHALNSKWRIFERGESAGREPPLPRLLTPHEEEPVPKDPGHYDLLKLYHAALLETLEPGVLVLDSSRTVISENEALLRLLGLKEKLSGKHITRTPLLSRIPELGPHLEGTHTSADEALRFETALPAESGDEVRQLAFTVKPIITPKGGQAGTLIYVEDVSPRGKLSHTIQELETTAEELRSTNEELETTNEELQSTNEELETTNEELQSTNEELETANEELQALNEELGTTNEELEVRTRELDHLNSRYSETLEKMPWPLMLAGHEGKIEFWNGPAEKLFGLAARSVLGLQVDQLPFAAPLRAVLARNFRSSLTHAKPRVIRNVAVDMPSFRGQVDIRFSPLAEEGRGREILMMFQAAAAHPAVEKTSKPRHAAARKSRRSRKKN